MNFDHPLEHGRSVDVGDRDHHGNALPNLLSTKGIDSLHRYTLISNRVITKGWVVGLMYFFSSKEYFLEIVGSLEEANDPNAWALNLSEFQFEFRLAGLRYSNFY